MACLPRCESAANERRATFPKPSAIEAFSTSSACVDARRVSGLSPAEFACGIRAREMSVHSLGQTARHQNTFANILVEPRWAGLA